MKHIMNQTVYYADTDAYGVAWHGAYIKWMEQARVEFCRELGLDLVKLKEEDSILTPVTNLSIRYNSPAKLDERITIETQVKEMTPLTIKFAQIIKSKETEQVHIIAEVEVVSVNDDGKIYRKTPDVLRLPFERAMNN